MRRTTAMMVVGLLLVTLGGEAAAQTASGRDYYFSFGGGGQSGSTSFEDERVFTEYDEQGRLIVNGSVGSLSFFDIAVGRRITGSWTLGLAFHKGSKTGSGLVVVGVPHPLFFDRARSDSKTVEGLKRDEHATHLQLGYLWDATEKIQVHVVAGPSFFRVKQATVTEASVSEVGPPYTSVNATYNIGTRSKNVVGGHIGVDGSYRFYDHDRFSLGAGAFLRYAGASADLQILDNEVKSSPGGFQYGVNLRVGF